MDWIPLVEWLGSLAWLRLDLLFQLVLASVLGGLIGLEREISGKPAGFRTNLLICVGAALLTDLSIAVSLEADPSQTNADPARIAAQIVSGIGFLGAGTIIQSRGSVVGLTTAATLWVVAAIGIAVGAGAYVEATGTALLVIAALIVLGRVEAHFIRQREETVVRVTVDPEHELVHRAGNLLAENGFAVETMAVEKEEGAFTASFLIIGSLEEWDRAVEHLLDQPGVRKVAR